VLFLEEVVSEEDLRVLIRHKLIEMLEPVVANSKASLEQ